MDLILIGFVLVAAFASVGALLAWWRRRPWTAAAIGVVALLAVTPLTRGMPDAVIVAGLLGIVGAAGWALWPRPPRRTTGDTEPRATGPDGYTTRRGDQR